MAGSICLRNLLPKATSSEERSTGGSQFFNEKRDGVIILENVKEDNKNEFDKTVIEDTKPIVKLTNQNFVRWMLYLNLIN